ncbi:MAG: ankyrin repeat domain-containing protein [Bacteroidota bacterium]
MIKHISFAVLMCLPSLFLGQDQNIFHDRSFWENGPSVDAVKAEIEKGNDPVALTPSAFDAVVYAILGGAPTETIEYLLTIEGNEVDKTTHDGRNYLLWAGYKGNLEVMELLYEKGSQADLVDDHGYNMMTFSAVGGNQNPAVYDMIMAKGGKVTDANRSGATALHLITPYLEDASLLDYFVEKGLALETTDNAGNGLFNYAAQRGNMAMMKLLMEKGLDYQGINENGGNAMLFASRGGRGHTNDLAVFEYLEGLGLESDIVNFEGNTPLYYLAGSAEDEAIIDFFLEKGVNPNQVNKDGNTAFLNAVRYNNLPMAQKLAPMVKDMNQANHDGYTALTYAVMRNNTEAFEYLLAQGAKMDIEDAKGRNLVYHIFNSYRSRNAEAFASFLKVAEEHKLMMTPTYEGGNTLAHMAIAEGEMELLQKALELGVDINQRNADGLTPLHLAAMKAKDKEMLAILLDKGAEKSILTDFEESAYDLAKENEALSGNGIDVEFLKLD